MKIVVCLYCFLNIIVGSSFAAEQNTSNQTALDGISANQAELVLAKMSDEQVRGLLLEELGKDLSAGIAQQKGTG